MGVSDVTGVSDVNDAVSETAAMVSGHYCNAERVIISLLVYYACDDASSYMCHGLWSLSEAQLRSCYFP